MSRIDRYHVGFNPIDDQICIYRSTAADPSAVLATRDVTDEVMTAVMHLMKGGLNDQQLSALEIKSSDDDETWLLVLQKKPEESRLVLPN